MTPDVDTLTAVLSPNALAEFERQKAVEARRKGGKWPNTLKALRNGAFNAIL